MSDNVIVPCPQCGEQCAIAPVHLSRLLACPHCTQEFVPDGGGGGGGGGEGGRRPPPPRDDRDRDRGRRAAPRGGGNNNSLLMIGGVVVLLVIFIGWAASGGSDRKRRKRKKSDNTVSVTPEAVPGMVAPRAGAGGPPPVHPDESITLQSAESGSYRVNGNVRDTLMSVRVWKDPHALSRGKRSGRIAHDDKIEVLGKATNRGGILVYKVRGKYKGGSSTVEGWVSAFYIEKDYKVIAEHNWDWMDHDELQRRGKD